MVSQKLVPLISYTVTFDQNFLFLLEIVTGIPILFFYHILEPLPHEVGYSV